MANEQTRRGGGFPVLLLALIDLGLLVWIGTLWYAQREAEPPEYVFPGGLGLLEGTAPLYRPGFGGGLGQRAGEFHALRHGVGQRPHRRLVSHLVCRRRGVDERGEHGGHVLFRIVVGGITVRKRPRQYPDANLLRMGGRAVRRGRDGSSRRLLRRDRHGPPVRSKSGHGRIPRPLRDTVGGRFCSPCGKELSPETAYPRKKSPAPFPIRGTGDCFLSSGRPVIPPSRRSSSPPTPDRDASLPRRGIPPR